MESKEATERILKISKSIRMVTICDMKGNLIYHARPKSIKSSLTPAESRKSLKISARNMSERKKLARKLGKCKYTLAEYDKVKRLVIPAGANHLFYVTCSPRYDHNKIIQKIRTFR
ncbi:MAG: hypothetical protein K8823_597 [Cenarchaeum symbiont of Oopsacas minuta]|nr:hypothetical protein [Cenarchaeum symbiont of Oopsacas minuta]